MLVEVQQTHWAEVQLTRLSEDHSPVMLTLIILPLMLLQLMKMWAVTLAAVGPTLDKIVSTST